MPKREQETFSLGQSNKVAKRGSRVVFDPAVGYF